MQEAVNPVRRFMQEAVIVQIAELQSRNVSGHLTVSERFTNKPVTHNHRGTKVPGSEPKPEKAG
jgi:hypothetical protein